MSAPQIVLDTNVFVAAGFNRGSAAASILEQVRMQQLRMVWNDETRRETQYILEKIPPLSWEDVAELFREENYHQDPTNPERFAEIRDPDDRKFAALAESAGAVLLTNDDHLLSRRDAVSVEILTPGEFWERIRD